MPRLFYPLIPAASAAWLIATAAVAAPGVPPSHPVAIQSPLEALAQDAREYASRHGVSHGEALSRLRALEESVQETDRLAEVHRDRLAGIAVEHVPDLRIVVLLTGNQPVPDATLTTSAREVPILFRTGAAATREAAVSAMEKHQRSIRKRLPRSSGMGFDQRSGELVMLVRKADIGESEAALDGELEALIGLPVRIRLVDGPDTNDAIEGGARVEGIDPANGRRYACTTGFVVTDGSKTGVVTAAHCPDSLVYKFPAGGEQPLSFEGQWGWSYQDVQLHVSDVPLQPLFYVTSDKSSQRAVRTWRLRNSMRAGDLVCRRGETSGYSCSEVELTDYAPPGDLCGGPCAPVWTTVTGPACKPGDSGGPVFIGTTALGIVKGGNYRSGGRCNFYYYMATDYLPPGWRLLHQGAAIGSSKQEELTPGEAQGAGLILE